MLDFVRCMPGDQANRFPSPTSSNSASTTLFSALLDGFPSALDQPARVNVGFRLRVYGDGIERRPARF